LLRIQLASFLLIINVEAEAVTTITREIEIDVPRKTVFDFVTNYTNSPKYTEPLVTFKPTSKIKGGNRARFDMVGEVFGIPFQS